MWLECSRRKLWYFSLYEEKEQTRGSLQEITTPLSLSPPLTHEVLTTSPSLENSSERTPCFKSLQEIYEITKYQNKLTFFCLSTNYKAINFEDTMERCYG